MPLKTNGGRITLKVIAVLFLFYLSFLIVEAFLENDSTSIQWAPPAPANNKPDPSHTGSSDSASALNQSPPTWINSTYTDPLSIQRFTRERAPEKDTYIPKPSILICLMTKDAKSWGSQILTPSRTFISFLKLLQGTKIDLSTVSLALLTSSEAEFHTYKNQIAHAPFARVSVYYHPGYDPGFTGSGRGNRHASYIQHARRAEMAKLRNYLMTSSLRDEEHIIWLDADIYDFSDGMLQAMIAQTSDPKVGVITVRSSQGPGWLGDYDKNAWKGPRTRPNEDERTKMRDPDGGIGTWVAHDAEGLKHMKELIQDTRDDELVELDAVGGTVLLLEARLVRQGLTFAPLYLVGLDWESEGWDGIETEGLCVIARAMNAGCYGMGGHWVTHHSLS